jgi:hypothetical protein
MPTVVFSTNTTGADFSGTEDARTTSEFATTNYGSTGVMSVFDFTDTGAFWIKEDLSVLPAGCTITDAYYEIYQDNDSLSAGFNFYRCLIAVTEAGITHTTYDGTNNWNTAGGQGVATDRDSSILCTIEGISSTGGYRISVSNTGLITFIQNIVNGTTNNGVISNFGDQDGNGFVGQSSEGTDAQRPKLTVTYTTSGGTVLMGQSCC